MNLKKLQNGSDIRGVGSEGIEGQPVNLTHRAVYSLACALWNGCGRKPAKMTCASAWGGIPASPGLAFRKLSARR